MKNLLKHLNIKNLNFFNLKNIRLKDLSLKQFNLGKLKFDTKKLIFAALVVALFFYLDFTFLLNPQKLKIKNANQKIAKLKEDLSSLNNDLVQMQRFESAKGGKREEALKFKRLISEGELVSLLQEISRLARDNNIQIIQMKPSKGAKESRVSERSKNKASSSGGDELKSILIRLDLVCAYHNFGKFINDLENASMFVSVESFDIVSEKSGYLQQKVNLLLLTYAKE